MKKFIIKFLYFLLIFIILSLTGVSVYFYLNNFSSKDIPAFNFSGSYSLNEKICFIQNSQKENRYKGIKVLALGSSMTLNNIYSKTVIKELKTEQFVNAASWGMSMGDDYKLLKLYNELYKPETLIIVCNLVDFHHIEKLIDMEFVKSFLNSDKEIFFMHFLINFRIKYYLSNFSYARLVRNCIHDYDYLKFDTYGTVNFKQENFNIIKQRWEKDYLNEPKTELQYLYLDSISRFCYNNGIKLICFHSPVRAGIYTKLTKQKTDIFDSHITKVENIMNKYNHTFVDSSIKLWPDSLFVDGTHLSVSGAKLFTEYCFDKMKLNHYSKK